jgi:hypothetical protein
VVSQVIFEPHRTGFEETKDLMPAKGYIIAGRYRVEEYLGQAAFSSALQCVDLKSRGDDPEWVCLKVSLRHFELFDAMMSKLRVLLTAK